MLVLTYTFILREYNDVTIAWENCACQILFEY